ncbi:MAG: hypothetical protein ACFFD7_08915 [Candidatus Thorarchaeota archaeon]
MTLISSPSRELPAFSFIPESATLNVNSPTVKLNVSITQIDANSDGEIDTN